MSNQKASVRAQRVGDQVLAVIAEALRRSFDPQISFVTLTGIQVSGDLRYAKIFWSLPAVAGGAAMQPELFPKEQIIKQMQVSLDAQVVEMRKLIAREINMRYTPEIRFAYDGSAQYAARIEELLEQAKRES